MSIVLGGGIIDSSRGNSKCLQSEHGVHPPEGHKEFTAATEQEHLAGEMRAMVLKDQRPTGLHLFPVLFTGPQRNPIEHDFYVITSLHDIGLSS